ncbi:MAG: deoxynucleoside kinase [Deltaproteobacteria bacterium]|nr:deoxynucleoside kinase [Deltaproteobacteria bacterium]
MTDRPLYIAVAGTIGAGKSSLVKWLCQHYDLEPFYEPHEANPYLEDFYGDMRRWAFSSQLFFLVTRFRHHREMESRVHAVVQDRTLYEDAEVFARYHRDAGNIDDRDWRTYESLYHTLRAELRPPDLMLYLRCPLRTLRKRIASRGRAYEQAIPTSYLRSLEGLYERWYDQYDRSPKLVIETERMDYVTRLFDRVELLKTLDAKLGATRPLLRSDSPPR